MAMLYVPLMLPAGALIVKTIAPRMPLLNEQTVPGVDRRLADGQRTARSRAERGGLAFFDLAGRRVRRRHRTQVLEEEPREDRGGRIGREVRRHQLDGVGAPDPEVGIQVRGLPPALGEVFRHVGIGNAEPDPGTTVPLSEKLRDVPSECAWSASKLTVVSQALPAGGNEVDGMLASVPTLPTTVVFSPASQVLPSQSRSTHRPWSGGGRQGGQRSRRQDDVRLAVRLREVELGHPVRIDGILGVVVEGDVGHGLVLPVAVLHEAEQRTERVVDVRHRAGVGFRGVHVDGLHALRDLLGQRAHVVDVGGLARIHQRDGERNGRAESGQRMRGQSNGGEREGIADDHVGTELHFNGVGALGRADPLLRNVHCRRSSVDRGRADTAEERARRRRRDDDREAVADRAADTHRVHDG